jgi:F-type H+-transporting ATPase subunit a
MLASGGMELDFYIEGIFPYRLFGQTLWITTTHVSLLIVMMVMLTFFILANRAIKKATEVPGTFQNIVEMIVDGLDNFTKGVVGKYSPSFRNYFGTAFIFIWISNTSGLFGLRTPTGDYGTTLALAIVTFTLINVNEIRYNKLSGFCKNLMVPMPLFFPLNLIGKISPVVSLSLRLFANNLSGIIVMAMIYGLLGPLAVVWPAPLHAFFDVFIGSVQAFVFCLLSLTFINNAIVGD